MNTAPTFKIGDRIHYVDHPTDTGTIVYIASENGAPTARFDGEADTYESPDGSHFCLITPTNRRTAP